MLEETGAIRKGSYCCMLKPSSGDFKECVSSNATSAPLVDWKLLIFFLFNVIIRSTCGLDGTIPLIEQFHQALPWKQHSAAPHSTWNSFEAREQPSLNSMPRWSAASVASQDDYQHLQRQGMAPIPLGKHYLCGLFQFTDNQKGGIICKGKDFSAWPCCMVETALLGRVEDLCPWLITVGPVGSLAYMVTFQEGTAE